MAIHGDVDDFIASVLATDDELTKEDVLEFSWFDAIEYGTRTMEDEVESTSRWHIHKRAVVNYEGQLFAIYYDLGATESQENEEDYTVKRVYPKSVTTIIYE